jgi:death on curing protein
VEETIGRAAVRDLGLLDSAAHRPRASAFGEDAYPTLHDKAAVLLEGIVRNRALVDGNKRLAWAAAAGELELAALARRLAGWARER